MIHRVDRRIIVPDCARRLLGRFAMKLVAVGALEIGLWEFTQRDRFGNIIDQWIAKNALAQEGQYAFLDGVLRNGTEYTSFYLGLVNDTPVKTDAVSDLTGEPNGDYGYARQEIEQSEVGWPTLALDSTDQMATSKTVTFTADGGAIGPVTYAFLTTALSGTGGKHIAFAALSQTRTLQDTESLSCVLKIKQQ